MELKTTIFMSGDSVCVRLPPALVEYLNINKEKLPTEAKIKDLTNRTAEIIVPVW